MLGVPRSASQKEIKKAYYEVSVAELAVVCVLAPVSTALSAGQEVSSRSEQGGQDHFE